MAWLSQQTARLAARARDGRASYQVRPGLLADPARAEPSGPSSPRGCGHIDIEGSNVCGMEQPRVCAPIKWEGPASPLGLPNSKHSRRSNGYCSVRLAQPRAVVLRPGTGSSETRIAGGQHGEGGVQGNTAAYLAEQKFGPTAQSFKGVTDEACPRVADRQAGPSGGSEVRPRAYASTSRTEQHHGRPAVAVGHQLSGHGTTSTSGRHLRLWDGRYPLDRWCTAWAATPTTWKRHRERRGRLPPEDAGE